MELLTTTQLDSIRTLAARLGIADWDVILAGDGSGSGWARPCGWATVLVDNAARRRQQFFGGMNFGTSGLAELMPYVQAMAWYHEFRSRLPREARGGIARVHVISDNAALVGEGKALAAGSKGAADVRANRPLWTALLAFGREGYQFHYHWIPRVTIALNSYCDELAGNCFRAMKEMPMPVDPAGRPVSIYDCNPDEERATPLHACARKEPPRKRRRGRANPDCTGADEP